MKNLANSEKELEQPAIDNIKTEFVDLLRSETQNKFEQPTKRKLFFYFSGTIKKLKQLLND